MPWCTKRASGPTISARCVRKAMTSCFTSRSMASMRSTSKVAPAPFSQIVSAASRGTDAEFGERCRGMRLDLEPDAELRLRRPDGDHLGPAVAGDHRLGSSRARPSARPRLRPPAGWRRCCPRRRRPALEHGRAGDEDVGPGLDDERRRLRRDAAVDLDIDVAAADHGPDAPHLLAHGRDEGLAAEARIDGHAQDEVDRVEDRLDARSRACRD